MSLPDCEVVRNNDVCFRTQAEDFTFSNGVLKGPEDQMRSLKCFLSTQAGRFFWQPHIWGLIPAFNMMLCWNDYFWQLNYPPVPDFLWELCIGDQEAGNVVGVEETDKGVDFRVHDWLTHEREGAMFDLQALLIPLQLYSRDTCKQTGIMGHTLRGLQTILWYRVQSQLEW